jgi:hypothetical protein
LQGLRPSCPFAGLVAGAIGSQDAFRLVSLGWRSGLERGWLNLGDRLQVLAITPLESDIGPVDDRVRMVRLALPTGESNAPSPLRRSSMERATALEDAPETAAEPLAGWLQLRSAVVSPPSQAEPEPDLAALIDSEGFAQVDFIHIDTEQAALSLLYGLGAVLARPTLLGVALRAHLYDDSFHDTDRLLREAGFDLFVLETVKYASAALPSPFMASHPSSTFGGRPLYGDLVYLRNPAPADQRPAAASLAKAAALRALLDLPDQAAELLVADGDRMPADLDIQAGLDLLTIQSQQESGASFAGYGDYIRAFEGANPEFYGFQVRHHNWMAGLQEAARTAPIRIGALEDKVRDLVGELHKARTAAAAPAPRRFFSARNAASAAALDRARVQVDQRSRLDPAQHAIFDHFHPYRGPLPPEFYLDYLGAKTRADYGEWNAPWAMDHYRSPPPPIDEEYFEWIDVLQAVLDAGDIFTMLELGAGYGRWSVRGALAARQLGKQVRLGVAEAEPKHQAWLSQHMRDNGVPPQDYRMFSQAVGGTVSEVAFTIGAPPSDNDLLWFGQAIMPLDFKQNPPVGEYYGMPVYDRSGWRAILVPQIPLSEVLKPYDFIDLADFDLQGAEGEAIAEAVDLLTRKVRRLHIGTHSEAIEQQLRDLLPRHGWILLRDYSLHKTHDTPFGRCDFVDGVQSWINPALI